MKYKLLFSLLVSISFVNAMQRTQWQYDTIPAEFSEICSDIIYYDSLKAQLLLRSVDLRSTQKNFVLISNIKGYTQTDKQYPVFDISIINKSSNKEFMASFTTNELMMLIAGINLKRGAFLFAYNEQTARITVVNSPCRARCAVCLFCCCCCCACP